MFLIVRETVSKTGVGATLPGVQIPLSPPHFFIRLTISFPLAASAIPYFPVLLLRKLSFHCI